MAAVTREGIDLLRSICPMLIEVVKLYALPSKYTERAVMDVQKHSKDRESFHALLYVDLVELNDLLQTFAGEGPELAENESKMIFALLRTLEDDVLDDPDEDDEGSQSILSETVSKVSIRGLDVS